MKQPGFSIYNYGELNIDETSRKVLLEEKTVSLTRTEFAILKLHGKGLCTAWFSEIV